MRLYANLQGDWVLLKEPDTIQGYPIDKFSSISGLKTFDFVEINYAGVVHVIHYSHIQQIID